MPTIAEIRQQYPQYRDMSDEALADSLHKKFYSDVPRAQFNEQLGLDPIRAQVRKEREEMRAKGIPIDEGYSRRVLQGMTFGAADEILAGLATPLEMMSRRTWSPAEGYKYAKAYQDIGLEDARKRQGILGDVAEALGGVGSGMGLARSGLTFMRPGMSTMGRIGAMGGEGAAYGGVIGFNEGGNSIEDRLSGAGKGAAIGGVVGAAIPAVSAAVGTVGAPLASNIRARYNPRGVAVSQVARGVEEAGLAARDVADDVVRAANEGQGVYTVADAMGNPGQRLLSSVTRSPGPGRTNAVEFLEQRQAGQGRRVANILAEGFNAPQTAQQTTAALTTARDRASDVAYQAARQNAGPVNLSGVISNIDDTLRPGVTPKTNIANDSIEATLEGFRRRLTDGQSTRSDFATIQRFRGDLSDAVNSAVRSGQGNRARLLRGVLGELDNALEAASPGFRAANRQHATNSRIIDAVSEGRNAAMRGRTENTVPAFQRMSPQEQAAYRSGYADPYIEQTQGAAFGVNKARPLTSEAFNVEARTVAETPDSMLRRIGRENRMFETRAHAVGGSRTADNLADQAALRVDPSIVASLLTGNFGGAARQGLAHATNALHGSTPAVREQIASILMQRGANPTFERELADRMSRDARIQQIANTLIRAGVVGGASGSNAVVQRR